MWRWWHITYDLGCTPWLVNFFMNKEVSLTLVDVASWTRWTTYIGVSFMFSPHDVLLLSLCVAYICFIAFMLFLHLGSYSANRLQYCKWWSNNVIVVLMFYGVHSKSFFRTLWWCIACGYEWYLKGYTLNKSSRMIYFTMPIVWTFPNLIVHVSILNLPLTLLTNVIATTKQNFTCFSP